MLSVNRQKAANIVPMFVGLLVACMAAASVISTTVSAPAYEMALYLTIAAGLLCSFLTVRGRTNLNFLGTITIVVAFTGFIVRRADMFSVGLLYPAEVVADSDIALAALLAWVMAGFCFIQSRREHTILALVSGLAVFGLMGTVNLNTSTIVAFCVYLFAAIYTFAYENLLTVREARQPSGREVLWRFGGSQLVSAAVLFVVVAVLAGGAGWVMYAVAPNLYKEASRLPWRLPQVSTASYAQPHRDFWVGGGPANLSKEVVMTVASDMPALWRGQVYNTYEGHSWFIEDNTSINLRRGGRGRHRVYNADTLRGTELIQTFRLVGMRSSAIFAAAQPVAVGPIKAARGNRKMVRLISRPSGAIEVGPTLLVGTSYEVVSKVPDFSAQQLRSAGRHYPSGQFRELYIEQVPLSVESELSGLVGEVTAGAQTPYDKVMRIMDFLQENYLYTDSPPRTPYSADSAVYFLLSSKRGSCQLFATAMAMMCRLAGVPARVATGFTTGEYDSASGLYLVRGTDAHAWVEVYFPGYGWVPFNPQASQRLEEQNFFSLWRGGYFRLLLGAITRVGLYVLVALALIGLMASMFVNFDLIGAWWSRLLSRRAPWNQLEEQWRRFYRKAFRSHPLQPLPGHTPKELLDMVLDSELIPVHITGTLRRATNDLYQLRYSAKSPTASQIDELGRRWAKLRKRI